MVWTFTGRSTFQAWPLICNFRKWSNQIVHNSFIKTWYLVPRLLKKFVVHLLCKVASYHLCTMVYGHVMWIIDITCVRGLNITITVKLPIAKNKAWNVKTYIHLQVAYVLPIACNKNVKNPSTLKDPTTPPVWQHWKTPPWSNDMVFSFNILHCNYANILVVLASISVLELQGEFDILLCDFVKVCKLMKKASVLTIFHWPCWISITLYSANYVPISLGSVNHEIL